MVGARMTAAANSQPPQRRSGSEKRQRDKGGVLVRLLPEERAAVEEKARDVGLSLASFFRACGLGAPGPRARRMPPVNAEVLGRAIAALNKVGSNLNQIAAILNAGGAVTTQECFAALAETRAAAAAIREILRGENLI